MPSKMKTRCGLCSKKCSDKIQLTWANVTYMGQQEVTEETKSFCSNKCKIGFIRTEQEEFLQERKELYLHVVEQTKKCFLELLMLQKKNFSVDGKKYDAKEESDFYKSEIKFGSLLVDYVDDCFSLKKTEYELYEKFCKLKAMSLELIEYASSNGHDNMLDYTCKTIKLLENTYEMWCVDAE